MRYYISGPMYGIPGYNFPYFNHVAAKLRAAGLDVVNPAEIDQPTLEWGDCIRRALRAMLQCDAIVLLHDWQQSRGALLELDVAHRVGMRVVQLEELLHARPR